MWIKSHIVKLKMWDDVYTKVCIKLLRKNITFII